MERDVLSLELVNEFFSFEIQDSADHARARVRCREGDFSLKIRIEKTLIGLGNEAIGNCGFIISEADEAFARACPEKKLSLCRLFGIVGIVVQQRGAERQQ